MIRTWHIEALVVGSALATVVLLSGRTVVEWVGALAVLASFMHAQIADRLAEREAARVGRPALKPRERRSEVLSVRLLPAERALIAKAAKRAGVALDGDWARAALVAAASTITTG